MAVAYLAHLLDIDEDALLLSFNEADDQRIACCARISNSLL